MGKRGIDKTNMKKGMNDLLEMEPKMKVSSLGKTATLTSNGIVKPDNTLVDISGNELIPKDPLEHPEVKKVLEYNESILSIEEEYSKSEIDLTDGGILIRLFKRVPIRNGLYMGFNVPIQGAKQMQYAEAKDPFAFDHVGIIVNFDSTYERRNEQTPGSWRYNIGDIVQINPIESMTIIENMGGTYRPAHLRSMFFRYDEERNYNELGYIKIDSRSINCRLPKFNFKNYNK